MYLIESQIIQLPSGGTLPRTVLNTPTGTSLAVQQRPSPEDHGASSPAPARPPRTPKKMSKREKEVKLCRAAFGGRVEEVRVLLSEGVDKDCEDGAGWTPLI